MSLKRTNSSSSTGSSSSITSNRVADADDGIPFPASQSGSEQQPKKMRRLDNEDDEDDSELWQEVFTRTTTSSSSSSRSSLTETRKMEQKERGPVVVEENECNDPAVERNGKKQATSVDGTALPVVESQMNGILIHTKNNNHNECKQQQRPTIKTPVDSGLTPVPATAAARLQQGSGIQKLVRQPIPCSILPKPPPPPQREASTNSSNNNNAPKDANRKSGTTATAAETVVDIVGGCRICRILVSAPPMYKQQRQQRQQQSPESKSQCPTASATPAHPRSKRNLVTPQAANGDNKNDAPEQLQEFHMGVELRCSIQGMAGVVMTNNDTATSSMAIAFPGNDNPFLVVTSVGPGLAQQAGFCCNDIFCWPANQKTAHTVAKPPPPNNPTASTVYISNNNCEGGMTTISDQFGGVSALNEAKFIQAKKKHPQEPPYRNNSMTQAEAVSSSNNSQTAVWKLLSETQLRDSFKWLHNTGEILLHVARKKSSPATAIPVEENKQVSSLPSCRNHNSDGILRLPPMKMTGQSGESWYHRKTPTNKNYSNNAKQFKNILMMRRPCEAGSSSRAVNKLEEEKENHDDLLGSKNNGDVLHKNYENDVFDNSNYDEHYSREYEKNSGELSALLPKITRDKVSPTKDVILGRPGNVCSSADSVYQTTLTAWWEVSKLNISAFSLGFFVYHILTLFYKYFVAL